MVRLAITAAALLLAGAVASKADVAEDPLEAQLQRDVEELRHGVEGLRAEVEARRLQTELATLSELAETYAYLVDNSSVYETEVRKVPAAAAAGDADLALAMDSAWLIFCGTLVMFMHVGFAMLETGSCRAKNASNVLMKNLVNLCVGTLGWYWFGWGFAYGGPLVEEGYRKGKLEYRVIGTREFAGDDFLGNDAAGNVVPDGAKIQSWFFQWAFCTAAATIVSGGVAERVRSPTYALFSFIMASFIYPVVVAWTWGYGWLADAGGVGFMDFAGSGVVHLTGGVSALVGAVVLGPRLGRFEMPEEFEPHNLPLVVFGTLALWFGWYGFNCGSTLEMHSAVKGALAAQVAMNTTLSATAGGITAFFLRFVITRCLTGIGTYDVCALCNGILAGLVSITAGCSTMECGAALLVGVIGGCVYVGSSALLRKLRIDDPVDASCVHGFCGVWGVLACGFFDWGTGTNYIHAWNGFDCLKAKGEGSVGCAKSKGFWLVVAQGYLAGSIVFWSGITSAIVFLILKKTGKLRVDEEQEEEGLDHALHSPRKAYTLEAYREDLHSQNRGQ